MKNKTLNKLNDLEACLAFLEEARKLLSKHDFIEQVQHLDALSTDIDYLHFDIVDTELPLVDRVGFFSPGTKFTGDQ